MLAAVAAASVLAAGCGGSTATAVPVTSGTVSVAAGDTLRVDLGPGNPSIGDSWYLVTPPDPAVLSDQGDSFDEHCDEPGCDGRILWSFVAAGPGTTSVVFRYCYRSDLLDCRSSPGRGADQPVTLTVRVR